MKRYEISKPRVACNIAAIAMTVLTIGVLVVLPAKIGSGSQEARALPESKAVATAPPEGISGTAERGTADDHAGVTRTSVNPRSMSGLGYGYDGLSAVAPTKRSRPAAFAR
jgi:hypothetical protein